MNVMIGLARKNTIIPIKQYIKPFWNDLLFSSPPNAVNRAITMIPIANMVVPKFLNSIKIVSKRLFNEENIMHIHLLSLFTSIIIHIHVTIYSLLVPNKYLFSTFLVPFLSEMVTFSCC